MVRMLGRVRPSWCPVCRRYPGFDCPDSGKSTKEQRQRERRAWGRAVVDTLMENEEEDFVGLMAPLARQCDSDGCKNVTDGQSSICSECEDSLSL